MATQRATDEAAIRRRLDELTEGIRAMDLERVMQIYAPDMVTFDIVPPLQRAGAQAKRTNWVNAFAPYQPPLDYEIRDLSLVVGEDVAFGRSLNRISGTLKNGGKNTLWLRWTTGYRKINGTWFMVHDHVSVPTDFETGKSLLDLQPPHIG